MICLLLFVTLRYNIMICHLLLWLLIWSWNTAAQQSFQIEDIPIEHYAHEEHQNDEIDVELMPRRPKKLLPLDRNDPLDLNSQESGHIQRYFEELTKPDLKSRPKRDLSSTTETPKKILEKIGRPLELLVIDTGNKVGKINNVTSTQSQKDGKRLIEHFLINDFIRFKRATMTKGTDEQQKDGHGMEFHRSQSGGKFVQANPHGSVGQSEKLTGDANKRKDITRETRGATKEQWVKQEYPVQRDETIFEDNLQLPSDSIRAPRVHFVTNGMQERDPLDYKFDRQVRSRSLNKYSPSDLSAEMDFYQPRIARNYIPRDRYNDRYPDNPRDIYRQEYPENNRNYSPEYNGNNRKRRIIYYATLPDISRNSRDDDFRHPYDRYAYRDKYDDRYISPDRYDTYRKRFYEPRYEEDRARDPTYPIKVTTDVKVREVKKNPERRVYSDVDRTRYNPN